MYAWNILVSLSCSNHAGQPSPDVFTAGPSARAKGDSTWQHPTILCRSSWTVSPRTSCRSELHTNELTGLHIVWHTAAAVALLGERDIRIVTYILKRKQCSRLSYAISTLSAPPHCVCIPHCPTKGANWAHPPQMKGTFLACVWTLFLLGRIT